MEPPGAIIIRTGALVCAIGLLCAAKTLVAPEPAAITTDRASAHAMRFHLALPEGWTRERTWPVVVVIPDAAREFEGNLARFVAARGRRPFILVAPEVLSCGGGSTRTAEHYSYSAADWDSISAVDDFAFDDAGLGAVLADVREHWAGEPKAFLTGWEAGGHTVWAQLFRRPERWRAVAPVSTNYQRRGDRASTGGCARARVRATAGAHRPGGRPWPPARARAGLVREVASQVSARPPRRRRVHQRVVRVARDRRRVIRPAGAATTGRTCDRVGLALRPARSYEPGPREILAGGIHDQRHARPGPRAGLAASRPARQGRARDRSQARGASWRNSQAAA